MKIIKQSRITLNMFKSIGFVLFFPKGLEIISVHVNIQFRCARLRKRAVFSQSLVLGFIKSLARHVPPQGKNKEQNILGGGRGNMPSIM